MKLPILGFAALICSTVASGNAWAGGDWVAGHNSRVRLIAAPVKYADGTVRLTAGIEIALDPGWKTYWRNPGDSGGVPPEFEWTKSGNVATATLLFPAPSRLADALGDSIGYKHSVLFPVTIGPADAGKPVTLDVVATYGVCARICIPEEHELTLTVDAADTSDASTIARALASVPSEAGADKDAPKLLGLKFDAAGGKPALLIEAQFPAGTSDAQVFAEALDSSFVPMADRLEDSGDGHTHFRIELTKSDDLKAPSGKQLRLTLVGDDGASEAMATIP
jgi:DsbC/DsbD-like thiol-disulfide interchange protein